MLIRKISYKKYKPSSAPPPVYFVSLWIINTMNNSLGTIKEISISLLPLTRIKQLYKLSGCNKSVAYVEENRIFDGCSR